MQHRVPYLQKWAAKSATKWDDCQTFSSHQDPYQQYGDDWLWDVTIEKARVTAEDNQLLQLSFTATYTTEWRYIPLVSLATTNRYYSVGWISHQLLQLQFHSINQRLAMTCHKLLIFCHVMCEHYCVTVQNKHSESEHSSGSLLSITPEVQSQRHKSGWETLLVDI